MPSGAEIEPTDDPSEATQLACLFASSPELLAEVKLFAEIARLESPNTILGGWDWKGMHERLSALLARVEGAK